MKILGPPALTWLLFEALQRFNPGFAVADLFAGFWGVVCLGGMVTSWRNYRDTGAVLGWLGAGAATIFCLINFIQFCPQWFYPPVVKSSLATE